MRHRVLGMLAVLQRPAVRRKSPTPTARVAQSRRRKAEGSRVWCCSSRMLSLSTTGNPSAALARTLSHVPDLSGALAGWAAFSYQIQRRVYDPDM